MQATTDTHQALSADTPESVADLTEPAFYPKPAYGWTCFHCGETFMTYGLARDHFGFTPSAEPGCRIKLGAERGLLMALRKAEKECAEAWFAIHNETTDAAKAYYAASARHQEQLRTAEEAGYERGLHDGTVAQAAEIARLKASGTKFAEAMGCALWSAAAERERAEAGEARATVVEAALAAERAKVQAALSTLSTRSTAGLVSGVERVERVDPLARELAEVVDETWTFLAVWSQTYASERNRRLHPVHARMLARVHAVMTSAHAAGLIPTAPTTRLPVILVEHGYNAAGLLTEGEGR